MIYNQVVISAVAGSSLLLIGGCNKSESGGNGGGHISGNHTFTPSDFPPAGGEKTCGPHDWGQCKDGQECLYDGHQFSCQPATCMTLGCPEEDQECIHDPDYPDFSGKYLCAKCHGKFRGGCPGDQVCYSFDDVHPNYSCLPPGCENGDACRGSEACYMATGDITRAGGVCQPTCSGDNAIDNPCPKEMVCNVHPTSSNKQGTCQYVKCTTHDDCISNPFDTSEPPEALSFLCPVGTDPWDPFKCDTKKGHCVCR